MARHRRRQFSNQGLSNGFYGGRSGCLLLTGSGRNPLLLWKRGAWRSTSPRKGAEILEKRVSVVTLIGNAAKVTATIDQSLVFRDTSGGAAKVDDHAEDATGVHA